MNTYVTDLTTAEAWENGEDDKIVIPSTPTRMDLLYHLCSGSFFANLMQQDLLHAAEVLSPEL